MNDDGFGHWLAGFLDGEGHFALNRFQSPDGQTRRQFALRVRLREDDLAVLQECQSRLGGKLGRESKASVRARGSKCRDAVSWTMSNKEERLRIVEILRDHPMRSKKAAEFEIWAEAVEANARGRELDPFIDRILRARNGY